MSTRLSAFSQRYCLLTSCYRAVVALEVPPWLLTCPCFHFLPCSEFPRGLPVPKMLLQHFVSAEAKKNKVGITWLQGILKLRHLLLFFYILPSTFPVAYKTVGSPGGIFWRKGSCAGQRGRKYKGKQYESSIEVGGWFFFFLVKNMKLYCVLSNTVNSLI